MVAVPDDGYDPGFSVKVEQDADALLREAFRQGQASAFARSPRAQIPGASFVYAALAWLAFVAVACALAWPIGVSLHAVWLLFLQGWGVVG